MAWAGSYKIGCGLAFCRGDVHANMLYIACHYNPA